MRSSKKSQRAGRTVRKTLADGTVRVYRYGAWRPKKIKPAGNSLDALLRAYRRSPAWAELAPRTKKTREIYLRPLERVAALKVKDATRRYLLGVRDAIAQKRGNGAANAFVTAVGALFSFAVQYEWVAANPVSKIGMLKGGTLTAWTPAQADKASHDLPEPLRRAVVLARFTGQRRSDLVAMRWSQYDGAAVRLKQQKTGVELTIPCHPALKAELDRWKREASSVFILVNGAGRPWNATRLSMDLPEALRAIGLPPLGIHGLRKLMGAELAESGASTREIGAITGHRTLKEIERYTASADQERLAGAAIVKLQRKK